MNFNVVIEPDDLKGMRNLTDLEHYIKDQAHTDVQTSLANDLAEFMGEDPEDSSQWDTKSLQSWAMSRFQVQMSQSQMRKLDAFGVEQLLKEAALEQIDKRDCLGLQKYLERNYAVKELLSWAGDKFNVNIALEELMDSDNVKPAGQITEIISHHAKEAYFIRELEYPVDQVMTFAFGDSNSSDNAYGADFLRSWVLAKYGVDWSLDHVRVTPPNQLRTDMIALQEKLYEDGGIEEEIDAMMKAHPDDADLLKAVNARFAMKLPAKAIEGDAALKREKLIKIGKSFLRRELTELEQFVLIQIFDQSWKDHLYAMDMLKAGIGLQAFAEKDPRIAYKKEGFRYFQEMMVAVRDKVTDLIFRARVGGQPAQRRNAYNVTSATHETDTAYGVSENLRQSPALPLSDNEMQAASEQAQGEAATKVKTIVRDTPRVGRNDPCPCGSGKKYKKCHGANVV
jgi:preprotein translocase subunit SecA